VSGASNQTAAALKIAEEAPVVDKPRLLTVQEAIARVMFELPNIGKGDKSPEGYQYRGIEAVTKHAQPLFAKYGVVIAPRARVTQVVPSPAMKDGWQDVYVEVDWLITGPDGTTIEARTNGIGRDRSDKGANKGQTQAYKYLLLHLLCIADGKDDADGQTYEHDRQEVATTPGFLHSIIAATEGLTEAERGLLRDWLKEQGLPDRPSKMNEEQANRVCDWILEALPKVETAPGEGVGDGS
jgi:hypothetical protein